MTKLAFALLCATIALASARPAAAFTLPSIVPPTCTLQWVPNWRWVTVGYHSSGEPIQVLVVEYLPVCR